MKDEYPHICVLFLLVNYTLKLQLIHIILQTFLKCGFSNCFKQWSTKSIQEQVENMDYNIVHFDFQINVWGILHLVIKNFKMFKFSKPINNERLG
jgi:hypothetical protein